MGPSRRGLRALWSSVAVGRGIKGHRGRGDPWHPVAVHSRHSGLSELESEPGSYASPAEGPTILGVLSVKQGF